MRRSRSVGLTSKLIQVSGAARPQPYWTWSPGVAAMALPGTIVGDQPAVVGDDASLGQNAAVPSVRHDQRSVSPLLQHCDAGAFQFGAMSLDHQSTFAALQ